jgi:hypothetical protein
MNLEGRGRRQSWPILRYYPIISLETLRKSFKIFSQDSHLLNPWTTKYQAGVPTSPQLCSVSRCSVMITVRRESCDNNSNNRDMCHTMFKVLGRCSTLLCDCLSIIISIQLGSIFFRNSLHNSRQVLFQLKRMYIFRFEVLTCGGYEESCLLDYNAV